MKTIDIKKMDLIYLDLKDLNPFQGELKSLSKENYDKLRHQIITKGFKAPFFVWLNPSDHKYYITDGHQRDRVLTQMRDAEKFIIPPLPCVLIEAENEWQAKNSILDYCAQYGEMTHQSVYQFGVENNIPVDELIDSRPLPGIDPIDWRDEYCEEPEKKEEEQYIVDTENKNILQINLNSEEETQTLYNELCDRGFVVKILSL